jgi:DNA-binding transcriptional regulator GbsR (MarR family)
MSKDKKPKFRVKTVKLTGWVTVKPRQESQKTERREDIKRRIDEELEFLMEMEDRIPRKDEKEPVDYETEQMEQMIELCVDGAMADLRRALPPEELEIYEKCYRFFKRTSSKIIRDYTAEQILRRAANLRGEK